MPSEYESTTVMISSDFFAVDSSGKIAFTKLLLDQAPIFGVNISVSLFSIATATISSALVLVTVKNPVLQKPVYLLSAPPLQTFNVSADAAIGTAVGSLEVVSNSSLS